MNDEREISSEESERIDAAARISDCIFRFAVGRTANAVGVSDYEPGDHESILDLCDTHPQIIAGFMQTIAAIYASGIQRECFESVEARMRELSP